MSEIQLTAERRRRKDLARVKRAHRALAERGGSRVTVVLGPIEWRSVRAMAGDGEPIARTIRRLILVEACARGLVDEEFVPK